MTTKRLIPSAAAALLLCGGSYSSSADAAFVQTPLSATPGTTAPTTRRRLALDHGNAGHFRRSTLGGGDASPASPRLGEPFSGRLVRRCMFEFGRNVAEVGETTPVAQQKGSSGISGGGGWKVPRSAVEALGRGAAADLIGGDEFEFELTEGTSSKKTKGAVRGSFFFPAPPAEESEAPPPKSSAADASSSFSPPHVVVRHLRETDLPPVVEMCVEEFGSYSNPYNDRTNIDADIPALDGDGYVVVNNGDTDLSLGKILEPLWTAYENWSFSWIVRVGLFARIVRSRDGREGTKPHDHNVLCLVETSPTKRRGEVVAMAELSLQPPDPLRNAPPYVLPLSAKRALGAKSGYGPEPRAYVSNVLVRPDRRGYGYGRAVMAACEGLARSDAWNNADDVSLHVDADVGSGRAAQGLYRSMGYIGVADERARKKMDGNEMRWMGPEQMARKGLYVVEGMPLLYLRKNLKNR